MIHTTYFNIIGFENRLECHVELVKCDDMKMSRRPTSTFNFKDPRRFMEAIKGKNHAIIYVGKVKADDGTETWKGLYWEPSESTSRNDTWVEGRAVLPPGSIAWLDMDSEYDLEWALRELQDEYRKFNAVTQEVNEWAGKIRNVDRTHKFADSDLFKYMSVTEKEQLIPEMRVAYAKLTHRNSVELAIPKSDEDDSDDADELEEAE